MTAIMDNKTLDGLDWSVVCAALMEQCQTSKGKERARTGDFAHDREESLRRFDVIDELWTFDDDGEHPPIAAVHDVEALLEVLGPPGRRRTTTTVAWVRREARGAGSGPGRGRRGGS